MPAAVENTVSPKVQCLNSKESRFASEGSVVLKQVGDLIMEHVGEQGASFGGQGGKWLLVQEQVRRQAAEFYLLRS